MPGGLRARPNEIKARSSRVDQPERTAHYDCAMCIAEMLHNTRLLHGDSSVNIHLPPDQHQMKSSGGAIKLLS